MKITLGDECKPTKPTPSDAVVELLTRSACEVAGEPCRGPDCNCWETERETTIAQLSALSDAGLAVTDKGALRIANETATRALERENEWRKHLGAIQELAGEQAEDQGLWFVAATAPEAYLQKTLRRLHEVIEGKTSAECAEEAMAAAFHPSQLEKTDE